MSLSSVDPRLLCSPVTGAAFTGSLQDHDQGQCPSDIAPFYGGEVDSNGVGGLDMVSSGFSASSMWRRVFTLTARPQ